MDSKKPGAPQLTCNNNFVNAIKKILPADVIVSKQAPLCQWIPLAQEKNNWINYIEDYFKSCRSADYEDFTASARDDENTKEKSLLKYK